MNSDIPTLNATTRLNRLLKSKKNFIPYHEDLPDKEYPQIKLSIYGAPKTNELFVKITNGKATFVEVFESNLLHPAMEDRIFGMDVEDSNDAFARADKMWEKHKAELLKK
jgi:hypothetical protein